MQLGSILKEAMPVVRRAAEAILDLYHKEYKVFEKNDKSPVTEADLLADFS